MNNGEFADKNRIAAEIARAFHVGNDEEFKRLNNERLRKFAQDRVNYHIATEIINTIIDNWFNVIIHDIEHIGEYSIKDKSVSDEFADGVKYLNEFVNAYLSSLYSNLRLENESDTTTCVEVEKWANEKYGKAPYKSIAEVLEEVTND